MPAGSRADDARPQGVGCEECDYSARGGGGVHSVQDSTRPSGAVRTISPASWPSAGRSTGAEDQPVMKRQSLGRLRRDMTRFCPPAWRSENVRSAIGASPSGSRDSRAAARASSCDPGDKCGTCCWGRPSISQGDTLRTPECPNLVAALHTSCRRKGATAGTGTLYDRLAKLWPTAAARQSASRRVHDGARQPRSKIAFTGGPVPGSASGTVSYEALRMCLAILRTPAPGGTAVKRRALETHRRNAQDLEFARHGGARDA